MTQSQPSKSQFDDRDNMELTLGRYMKFPITEFGEDEGIPKLPQNYVNTKKYLASANMQYADIQQLKSKLAVRADAPDQDGEVGTEPKLKTTHLVLKAVPPQIVPLAPKESTTKVGYSRKSDVQRKQLRAQRRSTAAGVPGVNFAPNTTNLETESEKKLTSVTSIKAFNQSNKKSGGGRGSAKSTQSTAAHDSIKPKLSFRSELAGMTGKPHLNTKLLRSVQSLTTIQQVERKKSEVIKIGVIRVTPEIETPSPLIPTTPGKQKKMLIAQKISSSAEEILGVHHRYVKKPSRAPSKFSRKTFMDEHNVDEDTLESVEDEFLHDKPNYAKLSSPDTTQIAKLILKQFPEITRARAHLSQNAPPILQIYPNHYLSPANIHPGLKYQQNTTPIIKRINFNFDKSDFY